MIISHHNRFIFFHNPKTAGMSLRAALACYHDDPIPLDGIIQRLPFDYPMDFAHLRLWEIAGLFPSVMATARSYRSLVFVRDPYRRFVSAVDQHFKTCYPELPLPAMAAEEQLPIVEMFVDKMLPLERVRNDHGVVHFSPQVWFVQSDGFRLPGDIVPVDDHGAFIARGFQSLGLAPRAVPHVNRSRVDLTRVLASKKIRAFVRDFYADDFAFFAADPALAHLAAEPSFPVADRACSHAAGPVRTYDRQCPQIGNGAGNETPPGSIADLAQHRSNHPDAVAGPSVLTPDLLASACPVSAGATSAGIHQPMDVTALMASAAQIDRAAVDLAAGRARAAFDRVRLVLAENPGHPRALGMLGQIAVFADHPAAGLAPLQRAAALDPRLEHWVWLALCLAKLGCGEDAVQVITAATRTMPPTANAHSAVGMVFYALGRYDDAARFYGNSVALDARRADAQHRYARALQAAGKTAPAIHAYMKAIRNCATQADYYADLSGALSDMGRFEEACAAGKTAVELDPGCIVGHNNLGHALYSLSRSADAVRAYEQAIDACDSYAKAQLGRALALLKCGDFERGWRQYEWRWQAGQTLRADPGAPLWRGEDIRGKTILLHAEQGLGDTLQFVRFAPLVAARGAHVVLEVPPPLVRLLRGVEGVAQVVASGDPIPPIDRHCPMASLPMIFDLRLGTIPASPYLHRPCNEAGPSGLPRQHSRPSGCLVVGLVWAGEPRAFEPSLNRIDRRRSTTLDVLAPLLGIDGVRFASFQFGAARDQLAAGKWPVVDAMEGVTDFADTAARLAGVDLLISVDTSMVHLAGGLGMPVWMLSRFDGCWRWLERRTDSPWYPSMRIFRQPSPGDWPSVVAEVAAALTEVIRGRTMIARRISGQDHAIMV